MTIDTIVARWEEKLRKFGEARAAEVLVEEQRRRGLVYGDRPVCRALRPLFLQEERADALARDAETLRDALGQVVRELPQRPELEALLQLRDAEKDLMSLDPADDEPDLFGRLDAVLGDDGRWQFLEYNGESPGGLGYGDALGEVFESFAPFAELVREFGLTRRDMRRQIVDAYLARWRRSPLATKDRLPRVLIFDLPDPPTIGEFRVFQAAFEAAGCEAFIGSPEDLAFDGVRLRCRGKAVDLVYRRLLTADLLADTEMIAPLAAALRAGRVISANGLRGYLYAHKGLLGLLSDPETRPESLDEDTVATLERILPWTRIVRPGATRGLDEGGVEELREIVKREKDRLVLKPAADYGGRGITLGWLVDDEAWEAAWQEALTTRAVVQERAPMRQIKARWAHEGQGGEGLFYFDLAPYILDGRISRGMGVRFSADALLNVAAGGGSAVPVFYLAGT